jgi:molybdopterin-guanine dinucleotide biosynthesis protein A/8-oxo-dGTP pyrophosphatase MutT (NUDIX family)
MILKCRVALLLAGGRSQRVGAPKGVVAVQGRPWLHWQLDALRAVGISTVVLVVGHYYEEYAQASEGFSDVIIVRNPQPELGPFSSLQCGLEVLSKRDWACSGVFVLPVDVPVPSASVWQEMSEVAVDGVDAVLPQWDPPSGCFSYGTRPRSRRGHPVWLATNVLNEVRACPSDSPRARLDVVLREVPLHKKKVASVQDVRPFLNLNYPSDFRSWGPLVVASIGSDLHVTCRERASVFCVNKGDILVVRAHDPLCGESYCFPVGGGLELGESPQKAAEREAWEESGHFVSVEADSFAIGDYFFPWSGKAFFLRTHFFRGALKGVDVAWNGVDDPAIKPAWVAVDEAREQLHRLGGLTNVDEIAKGLVELV